MKSSTPKARSDQTDFVNQLNMKRAGKGELARTIRSLDGVTFARVHLVLPERQLFQDSADQATASKAIRIQGARALDRSRCGRCRTWSQAPCPI